jgi:hypothetical protein
VADRCLCSALSRLCASSGNTRIWNSALCACCVCTPAQKHADAAVLDLIAGMPSWVDAAKVEANYLKAKGAAPAPSFPSPYYPAAAAEATVTAANMKLLHAAYAKA